MKILALAILAALLLSTAPLAQGQIRQCGRNSNQATGTRLESSRVQAGSPRGLLAPRRHPRLHTDYDGSFMNKSEYLKWVAAPQQKADHIYDEGQAVKVYGDAAVVTGIYRETGSNKGNHT